jgi:cysteine desulfurase / selenocysteine lyase
MTNSTSYGLDLLAHGLPLRAGDDQGLVQRLIDHLPGGWRLTSPAGRDERSTLVFVEAADAASTGRGFQRLQADGIDVAQRAGGLRLSPHLHNTEHDIDRALQALAAVS